MQETSSNEPLDIILSVDIDGTLIDNHGNLNLALLAILRYFHAQFPDNQLYLTTARSFKESYESVSTAARFGMDFIAQTIRKKIGIKVEISTIYTNYEDTVEVFYNKFYEIFFSALDELESNLKNLRVKTPLEQIFLPILSSPDSNIEKQYKECLSTVNEQLSTGASKGFQKVPSNINTSNETDILIVFEKLLTEIVQLNTKNDAQKVEESAIITSISSYFLNTINQIHQNLLQHSTNKNLQLQNIIHKHHKRTNNSNCHVVHFDDNLLIINAIDQKVSSEKASNQNGFPVIGVHHDGHTGLAQLAKIVGFSKHALDKTNKPLFSILDPKEYVCFLRDVVINDTEICREHKALLLDRFKSEFLIVLKNLETTLNSIENAQQTKLTKKEIEQIKVEQIKEIINVCHKLHEQLKHTDKHDLSFDRLVDVYFILSKLVTVPTTAEQKFYRNELNKIAKEFILHPSAAFYEAGIALMTVGSLTDVGGASLLALTLAVTTIVSLPVAISLAAAGTATLLIGSGIFHLRKRSIKEMKTTAEECVELCEQNSDALAHVASAG